MGQPRGRKSDLLVVIPALDEQDTVATVVTDALATLGADVLVVDDGSTDATAALARAAGAAVLQHPFNLGVGAAIRSGLRHAASRGYSTMVQIDADGQHPPDQARLLLDRLALGDVDLVVGSRFAAEYQVGRPRRAMMRLLSRMITARLGVRLTDTTSGFRAFNRTAISRYARAYPSAYLSDTVEALLLASDWSLGVAEVPVQMRERQGGAPSAGAAQSTFHLLRLFLVLALHKVRQPIAERGFISDVEA